MENLICNLEGSSWLADIPSAFIQDCLNASNDTGDGLLFTVIHCRRFNFNKLSKRWMISRGSGWQPDLMDEALVGVEDVADIYLREAENINKKIDVAGVQKNTSALSQMRKLKRKYTSRAWKLNSENGRRRCLNMAKRNLGLYAVQDHK